jgi:hypothetical protein
MCAFGFWFCCAVLNFDFLLLEWLLHFVNMVPILVGSIGVFGSEVFSQFWKNTAVFSNTAVLYTEWCLAT